jgi:hypothetical protein
MPARLPPPTEQLLRRQPVSARNRGDYLTIDVALGDNLRLLLRRPGAAPSRSGEHLQPAYRLRLGFVQKLSVRHVSRPLDSAVGHSQITTSAKRWGPSAAYDRSCAPTLIVRRCYAWTEPKRRELPVHD